MATQYFYAFQKWRASDANKILPRSKVKAADENVISSTTLQNDDELFISVDANITYAIDARIIVIEASGNAIDWKCAWTYPSGALFDMAVVAPHTAWNASAANVEIEWAAWQNETSSPSSSKNFGTATTAFSYHFRGVLRVGATAGTFQLQWAQANSTAANVTVKSGSSLTLTPLLILS